MLDLFGNKVVELVEGELEEKKETSRESKGGGDFNFFALSDALAARDKKGAWILLSEAFEKGIAGETLYWRSFSWKVKKMLENPRSAPRYSREEIVKFSDDLLDLYHLARNGETDFDVGLEKIVLGL